MSLAILHAHASDYAEVLTLLGTVNLPTEDVAEHFSNFFVARDHDDALLGCIGQERYGNVTLLRSLAVNPSQQGKGLGRELTLELLSDARAKGVSEVVLLTNTAAAFFQQHFGFTPGERANYDETLGASAEWKLPRCAAAVCLALPLV